MRKAVKKLVLHRETLRFLEEHRLMEARGAASTVIQREPTGCGCYTNDNCYPATACLGTCSCSG